MRFGRFFIVCTRSSRSTNSGEWNVPSRKYITSKRAGSYSAVTIAVVPPVSYRACLAPRLHEWNYTLSRNITYIHAGNTYVCARYKPWRCWLHGGSCVLCPPFHARALLSYYIIGVLNGVSFLYVQTVNIIFVAVRNLKSNFLRDEMFRPNKRAISAPIKRQCTHSPPVSFTIARYFRSREFRPPVIYRDISGTAHCVSRCNHNFTFYS